MRPPVWFIQWVENGDIVGGPFSDEDEACARLESHLAADPSWRGSMVVRKFEHGRPVPDA